MNSLERLGTNIRYLRKAYGETQEELGAALMQIAIRDPNVRQMFHIGRGNRKDSFLKLEPKAMENVISLPSCLSILLLYNFKHCF